MKKIIRRSSLMSRTKIPTKHPLVRFVCDHCDCIFEANEDGYDYKEIAGSKPGETVLMVASKCPDCRRNCYRSFHIYKE